jgi:hypothetical protein
MRHRSDECRQLLLNCVPIGVLFRARFATLLPFCVRHCCCVRNYCPFASIQGVLNALSALLEFALELDTGRYLQV